MEVEIITIQPELSAHVSNLSTIWLELSSHLCKVFLLLLYLGFFIVQPWWLMKQAVYKITVT
jgi:hypothetical protein